MPPKKSQRAPGHATPSTYIATKAEKMAKRLREHYLPGQRAINEKKVSTRDFAELEGLNENTLRKMKAFARSYTEPELKELCAGRRPNGLPLHWGYIAFLLAIQGKHEDPVTGRKARLRFQQLAIKKGWTVPELCLEIRRTYGNDGGHGRKLRPLSDLDAELQRLIREGQTLAQRAESLAETARLRDRRKLTKTVTLFDQQLRNAVMRLKDAS